jgi:hypothetical protein
MKLSAASRNDTKSNNIPCQESASLFGNRPLLYLWRL